MPDMNPQMILVCGFSATGKSMSLRNIEEYAEEIGLKKLDKAQIWYVDIQQEDIVKIPEKDENFFVKIKRSVKKFFYKFE